MSRPGQSCAALPAEWGWGCAGSERCDAPSTHGGIMNRTFKRCSTVGAGVDSFGAASIAEFLFPLRLGCGVCRDEMAVDAKLSGIVPGYTVSAHCPDNSRRRRFLCTGGVALVAEQDWLDPKHMIRLAQCAAVLCDKLLVGPKRPSGRMNSSRAPGVQNRVQPHLGTHCRPSPATGFHVRRCSVARPPKDLRGV